MSCWERPALLPAQPQGNLLLGRHGLGGQQKLLLGWFHSPSLSECCSHVSHPGLCGTNPCRKCWVQLCSISPTRHQMRAVGQGRSCPHPALNVLWCCRARLAPTGRNHCVEDSEKEKLGLPFLSLLEAAGTVSRVGKQKAHPEADGNIWDTAGHAHLSHRTLAALVVQQQSCISAAFPIAWAAAARSVVQGGLRAPGICCDLPSPWETLPMLVASAWPQLAGNALH